MFSEVDPFHSFRRLSSRDIAFGFFLYLCLYNTMLSVDQIDSLLNFSVKYFLLILSYLWYDLHVYHIRV